MGQIVLSGDELVCILTANALIPEQVTGVETESEEIRVHVATPWPILRSIPVRIRFAGFERGQVVLQLITNRFIDKFDWLVDRMLASLQLEDHGSRWEYPRFYVDVNKLLQRQVRGVEITSVVFQAGHFHFMTSHSANDLQPSPEHAPPTGQTGQP
jgi:hypothetical protein